MNNETQIKTLIENRIKAVNNKDMDAILAHHTSGIVMYDLPFAFQSLGIDAHRKTWDYFFNQNKELGFLEIKELQITADENVAFCFSAMLCHGYDENGKVYDLDFRLTVGLEKINNQWTITHEHHSIPSSNFFKYQANNKDKGIITLLKQGNPDQGGRGTQ